MPTVPWLLTPQKALSQGLAGTVLVYLAGLLQPWPPGSHSSLGDAAKSPRPNLHPLAPSSGLWPRTQEQNPYPPGPQALAWPCPLPTTPPEVHHATSRLYSSPAVHRSARLCRGH